MSHNHQHHQNGHGRGRGGRGRHHGGHHQQEVVPPNVAIRRRLFDIGDEENFYVVGGLNKKLNYIRNNLKENYDAILEAFQIGITQQPFKIPYWAVLLPLITEEGVESEVNWPTKILDDLVKAYQGYLDKLKWREIRLFLQFFAHLTTIRFITPESMLAQLSSFMAVIDEPGVSFERASMAAICTGEALLRACTVLSQQSSIGVIDIIGNLTAFSESLITAKTMTRPIVHLHSQERPQSKDQLDCLVSSLRELENDNFAYPVVLLRPQDEFEQLRDLEPSYELPGVLVPPQITDVADDISASTPLVRHRELPVIWLQLFDTDSSIDPSRAGGYLLRSTYEDVIDIYEVNRKEAARVLLDINRWFAPGTFRPRQAAAQTEEVTGGVHLELSMIETILSSMFVLPNAKHKSIYYTALITEICKLSAATIGPAVGKSIRQVYQMLGNGLDVEIARRFADWFAVHMSNFAYQWVWKEWVPHLSLDAHHPKRIFMRRALEIEIRLSYYDRIMKTLPEAMQSIDAGVMPAEAPGYEYEYESSSNSHHYMADGLYKKFQDRQKVPPQEISVHVDTMRAELISLGMSDSRAASRVRSITVQCLLLLGSRSFSHFLNAIERYLLVLRPLSSTPDAKFEILEIVCSFWRRNHQMIAIIFDKLMQYQIVGPTDIVSWAFEGGGLGERSDGLNTFQWDLMRNAIDKSNGRVLIAQRRVVQQRKTDEESRAAKQAASESMDVDDITIKKEEPMEESEEMQKSARAHQTLVGDQKSVLSRAVEGFATVLSSSDDCLSETAWERRESWTKREWDVMETWGWYRHFCRIYAPFLRVYKESLSTAYLSPVSGERPAGALLRQIWSITVEQDS